MKLVLGTLGLVLTSAFLASAVDAQSAGEQKADSVAKTAERPPDGTPDSRPYRVFYLKNASTPSEPNEILTAIRLLLPPMIKVFLEPTENAIVVRATPEDMDLIQKMIEDLDRPIKVYRITYSITELDGGRRIGLQRYALTAAAGQRATLKEGSKVPIVTGNYSPGTKEEQHQVTYLDVGMNFAATPDSILNGVSLKSQVEQSVVAPEPSGVGATDPIIRQSVLENASAIPLGKPTQIGSMDVPGSTRHLDIEVQVDLVK